MVILMDAGNSRLKWAVADSLAMPVQSVAYEASDKLATVQDVIYKHLDTLQSFCMVHVLGEAFEKELDEFCLTHDIDCRFIHANKTGYGITTAYDKPRALGADRYVAMVAAHHQYPSANKIVIDCGTAVTIDAIGADGLHLGGLIMPGLLLGRSALIKNTQLPEVHSNKGAELLATNTIDGINSGTIIGLSGAVYQICRQINESVFTPSLAVNNPTVVLLCGGDSKQIAQHFKKSDSDVCDVVVIPELVIQGLNIIRKQAW